jgi:hypothetical protein
MSARPGADVPYPKATEARKPDTPGRARYKPSNHCAGNVGCPPLNLYARVRFLFPFCTRDRGCSAHPAFPAPSDFKARNVSANLGRTAPRERESAFVISGGRIRRVGKGALAPCPPCHQSKGGGHAEPVIGRAFARPVGFAHPTRSAQARRTRWRSATRQPDRLTPSWPPSIQASPRPHRALRTSGSFR